MIVEVLGDASSRDPHPERGGNCLWFHPAEALASGTCPESGLTAADVEWDGDGLKVALALMSETSGTGTEARRPVTHGTRGPKPRDFWPKVLGYAAGWLAEKGEAPNRQVELERVILDRIEKLGGEADPSTVRPYARQMLAGYRAQLDGK